MFTFIKMKDSKIFYKITVKGRVQGVGFRQSALREARYLGIFGYVKNLPDGTVYIEAEGFSDNLAQFIKWCKRGPGYGSVEDVTIDAGESPGYNSFVIKY